MISANGVTLRLGKRALFEDVNIKFTEGNCYGIIGANGAGKSTFLKILSGQLEPTNGSITMTPGQRLSVLEQDHFKYDDCVVLDTVMMGNARLFEIMKEKDAIYAKEDFSDEDGIRASELEAEFAQMNGWEADSDAASLLNGLGIETDLHYKKMGELDGPDKVKVLLARALFGNPDILLMDEPTNHLDLAAIDWLEEFLINFENTVIVVSHDRYFMDKVVDHLMVFNGQGDIRDFPGNYSDYRDWKEAKEQKEKEAEKPQEEKTARVRLNDKRKMSFKEKREFEQLEKEIAELEAEKTQIEELLCSGTLSVDELTEKSKRLPEVNDMIDEKTMRWLELSEIEG